jgi:type IV secretory pathway ATPase VirB11/archaellum biosynthesis ATPase
MLGALRQAFKSLRRAIRQDRAVPWWSDNVKQYATFKALAAAMSVLLAAKTPTRNRPDAATAARAFHRITANHHEAEWIEAVPSLPR